MLNPFELEMVENSDDDLILEDYLILILVDFDRSVCFLIIEL